MKQLLAEPLVHFLAVGALLFLLFGLTAEPADEQADRILVSGGDVQRLSDQFARTWMRPPTETELAGLIDGFVREEIYYREALALGLDRDDPLVRQRMRQKLEFLLEDLSVTGAPSDAQLQAFLEQHADRFAVPPRLSFRQVYLNPDRHPDLDFAADRALSELRAGVAPETLGDRIMLGHAFDDVTTREIARSFGEGFAAALADLEQGGWQGPVDSGFGRHLVQVLERQPGRLPDLSQVRDRAAAEWLADQRRMRKEQAYEQLRQGYEVVIETPESESHQSSQSSEQRAAEGLDG